MKLSVFLWLSLINLCYGFHVSVFRLNFIGSNCSVGLLTDKIWTHMNVSVPFIVGQSSIIRLEIDELIAVQFCTAILIEFYGLQNWGLLQKQFLLG